MGGHSSQAASLGGDVDKLDARRRFRNRFAALFQIVDMQLDCFLNELDDLVTRATRGDAPRKIRHIGSIALLTLYL